MDGEKKLIRGRSNSLTKRKREGENKNEVQDIFQISKKTIRSPPKKIEPEMEVALTKLTEQIEKMRKDIQDEKNELKKEIQDIKKDLQEREDRWENKYQMLREENQKTRNRLEKLEEQLENKEKKDRRNNIIINGLKISKEADVKAVVVDLLQTKFKVEDVKIKEAFAVRKEEGKATIVVKLQEWMDKKKIMDNKKTLKGQDIYINNDLTKKKWKYKMFWQRKQEKQERTEEAQRCSTKKLKLIIGGIRGMKILPA